jgi:hypothetical protein
LADKHQKININLSKYSLFSGLYIKYLLRKKIFLKYYKEEVHMGATVDAFKATHQAAAGLLEQIGSVKGQQRVDILNSLKEALLSHIGEENSVIKEAMDKPDVDVSFKSSAQSFLDELGNIAQSALLPFFDKYSSSDAVDSQEFMGDFGGIKGAVSDRIAFEEEKFYPVLEKQGY